MAHVKLESKYGAVKVRGGNYRARYDDEQRPLRCVLKVAEVTFEDMSSAHPGKKRQTCKGKTLL